MHHDEARVGRFSVLFATAATLFGLLGVISVARASESPMPASTTLRQGTMTERLRDPVTFERVQGDELLTVATAR